MKNGENSFAGKIIMIIEDGSIPESGSKNLMEQIEKIIMASSAKGEQVADILNGSIGVDNSDDGKNKPYDNNQKILAEKFNMKNKHRVDSATITRLYRDCETAKKTSGEYTSLLNILKDIVNDEYLSENDRGVILSKINVCEKNVAFLKESYERLMEAIKEI